MIQKIMRTLARIKLGLQDCLYLGNLNARRDWGYALDYAEPQWLILQQDRLEDFVIAMGIQHSVRGFVNAAALGLSVEFHWKGSGVGEKRRDASGTLREVIDPLFDWPTWKPR